MYRKAASLILGSILMAHGADARMFHLSLSLIASYTVTHNDADIESGIFSIKNRKVNFGFEAAHKFYFPGNTFLKTGIRYNQYRTTINAVNQLSVLMNNPGPFTWERRFESFAVPLLIGRDFTTRNGNTGDFYAGASFGILMTSYALNGGTIALKRDPNNTDLIISQSSDSAYQTPSFFYPTLDFGASYHPVRSVPEFSLGLLCTFQLNRTDYYSYGGTVQNNTRNETYDYGIRHRQSFANCSVVLTYTFGKAREFVKRGRGLDCPQE